MKYLVVVLCMSMLTPMSLISQNLDTEGKIKISEMELNNSVDSVVVRLANGTLAVREVSTLSEFQILSISNDTLFLTNGGFIKLPSDQVDDADNDPNNEIQMLTILADTISLSSGGSVTLPVDDVDDADADPANEIQSLTLSNDTLYLSNAGSVKLPDDMVDDADSNPLNELQTLSISNDTIFLSNGNYAKLPIDNNAGWTMVVDTITTAKTVKLDNKLKINDHNYTEAASFGMTPASRTNIVNSNSGYVDLKYLFGDTTLFEPIHTGNFGVKIKKDGVLWISANVALVTSSTGGYTYLTLKKNSTQISHCLVSPTNSSFDGLHLSYPILVNADDTIEIEIVSTPNITTISGIDGFTNFNFLWFSR